MYVVIKEIQMDRRTFLKSVPAFTVLAGAVSGLAQEAGAGSDSAQGLEPIVLAKPGTDGGKSVMAALWERKTNRNVSDKELPHQVLSDLLWAAFGINRPSGPRERTGRTAASASNSQEIDLYVALAKGVYIYDATGHCLVPVVVGDFRRRSGRRSAATAPVNIFYVADIAKFAKAPFQEPGLKDSDVQKSYYYVGAGLIAQNVYLFAASQGLAAWFHNCDKNNTPKEFKLRPEQKVLFSQTVGYLA